jgi:putative glutamine amidotransferase
MPPRIAIAPCRTLPDYEASVRLAGGDARVLDWIADPVDQVIAWCDGLLLPGGVDVQPGRYGESPHPTVTEVNEARDAYEISLVQAALAADVPVLAICRGLQILNVAAGGTLVQDIPSQVDGALTHAIAMPKDAIAHEVRVSPGSRLAALMQDALAGTFTLQVNSRHHQSVRRVAGGFTVTASAPDLVVEALERDGARFCVGVQWHPENFWRTGEFRHLFEGLVAACARG